jgi:hypothetical protein
MQKKLSFLTSIVFTLSLLLSCSAGNSNVKTGDDTKKTEKKISEPVKIDESKADYLKQGEVIACYFDPHLFSAEFGVAKLISGDPKQKKYEVEWLYNSHATEKGKKSTVKLIVLKSHLAKLSELKQGDLVIYGVPNRMRRGIVKEIITSQNKIAIEWFHSPGEKINTEIVDIAIVRVIDEPLMKDPRRK